MREEQETTPDPEFMRRALQLALRGGGRAHPNPLVGAVIVRDGRVIAEGWHHEYGSLHAERDALRAANEAGCDARGADMYVTLEPCCHYGKQPPCTDAIIGAGIGRVVIGSRDPNPLVNGRGAAQLEAAGVEVVRDFLRAECDAINEVFFHWITTGTPYVIVKCAESLDGRIATSSGESRWITGEASRSFAHRLRGTTAAVMCGIGTVLKDDPLLTCREDFEGMRQPVRVVLDTRLRIPLESRLVKTAGESPVIVITASGDGPASRALEQRGVSVVRVPLAGAHLDIRRALRELAARNIDSVLVEGGGTVNGALFFPAEGGCLVDKVLVFIAPKIIGGTGATAVQGAGCRALSECVRFGAPVVRALGDDVLLETRILRDEARGSAAREE